LTLCATCGMITFLSRRDGSRERGRFRVWPWWALAILAAVIVAALSPGAASASPFRASSSSASGPVQNAINAAKQYLQYQPFSKQGLIDQLDSSYGNGYPVSVATAAVNSLNVNWNAEAVLAARQYLKDESFSCQGLIQQLSSSYGDKYTLAQAQYAARAVGLCGSVGKSNAGSGSSGSSALLRNAIRSAKQYLQNQAFSKQGLIDQLDSSYGDKYPVSVATAAVNSLKVNWNAEAVLAAKQYLQDQSFSCQGLIQQLSSSYGDKFTLAQAQYAARAVGLC
jgi:Host cell surface-exposed lipoprotein